MVDACAANARSTLAQLKATECARSTATVLHERAGTALQHIGNARWRVTGYGLPAFNHESGNRARTIF